MDEFSVSQKYAVLVFDVRRVTVSLPFQIDRLYMLEEAGLAAFSSACFEFADEVPEEASIVLSVPQRRMCLILDHSGTFNMPTSYQQWVWEREAHINWSMVTCQGRTRSELP